MKNIEVGKEVIKKELPIIPKLPGVYRMLKSKKRNSCMWVKQKIFPID
jgi:hypothetical protein